MNDLLLLYTTANLVEYNTRFLSLTLPPLAVHLNAGQLSAVGMTFI